MGGLLDERVLFQVLDFSINRGDDDLLSILVGRGKRLGRVQSSTTEYEFIQRGIPGCRELRQVGHDGHLVNLRVDQLFWVNQRLHSQTVLRGLHSLLGVGQGIFRQPRVPVGH